MDSVKFDVLVDKKAGDIGLTITDDNGVDGELTLGVEEAWALVTQLNSALRQLAAAETPSSAIQKENNDIPVVMDESGRIKPVVTLSTTVNIDARGSNPERVREAVLEAVGADQVRKERYSKPGFPATISKTGLREYIEPTEQVG